MAHLALSKFLQDVDLTAGEECGDDFERGVFGGGTYEGDDAAFDSTKEGVLLAFGETVDLVDEKDGAFFVLGFFDDLADFFDTAADGTKGVEGTVEGVADDHGKGGFADAGRSPENHGGDVAAVNKRTQNSTGTDKMLLADVVVEALWAENFG